MALGIIRNHRGIDVPNTVSETINEGVVVDGLASTTIEDGVVIGIVMGGGGDGVLTST